MTSPKLAIRRGDTVRLSDGKTALVLGRAEGYVFTTEGTYGPWQVLSVAPGERGLSRPRARVVD